MAPATTAPRFAGSRRAAQLCWASAVSAELCFWLAVAHDDVRGALAMRALCAAVAGMAALDAGIEGVQRRRAVVAAVTCVVLALPAFGLVSLWLVFFPAWSRNNRSAGEAPLGMPASCYEPDHLERQLRPSDAAPALTGYAARDVATRMRAVAALGRVPPLRAVPLLRAALGDDAEEVRLLAHAVLERTERRLRARLNDACDVLARADQERCAPDLRAQLRLEVAEAGLALARSGLLAERAREAQLLAAHTAIHDVTAPRLGLALGLARARIALARGDLGSASHALDAASALGASTHETYALRLELAFARGELAELDALLAEAPEGAALALDLSRARSFWQRARMPWSA
jgi:polysaccharide biosynthesis protein PelE